MVGVGAAVCVAVVFLFSDIHKNRKILGGVFVVAVGLVVLSLWKTPSFFRSVIKGNGEPCSSRISSMISDGTSVKITLDSGKMVTLRWDADATVYEFEALNENGKKIEMTGDSFSGVKLKGDAYQGLLFEATKRQITYQEQKTYFDVLRLTVDDKYSWDFAMLGVGLRYINGVGKPDMLHYVESFGMEGHYDFASNRGYIWSRTFPLLKRTLLLGVGRDNFAPLDGNIIMEMSTELGFAIVDRMLGGGGKPLEKNREFTEIELTIIERIMVVCTNLLVEPWHTVQVLEPMLERIETNSQFAQFVTPNEMTSIVTMSIKIGEVEGLMNVCIPYAVLEPVIDKVNTKYWYSTSVATGDGTYRDYLEESLQRAQIPVRAIMGRSAISVNDFIHLQPGDIIKVNTRLEDELDVYVGNIKKFSAIPGAYEDSYAVKIKSIYREE